MIKLTCTEYELNELVKQSIIEPQGEGAFKLYTKPNLKGESYPVIVACDLNADNIEVDEVIDNSIHSLEGWYNTLKELFPTNTGKHLSLDGRNLRTGNKSRIKKNIEKLIDESINLSAVVFAIKFEVWWRMKNSTVADNKLDFMQGMEAWLNNSTNIEAMIERGQESNEFKMAMNMNIHDSSGAKRKVKLS